MKIPAIRSKIGNWTYYVGSITFEQVRDYVSRVDEELHTSKSLKDMIQRSITENYISIKEYIINQPELFFNSLVLAVYDDYPNWREVEVTFEGFETYRLGLLEFPGNHKIFPLDGQHRVEGIKAALEEDPTLASEQISAIFVGHKNDTEGMRRSRRLFSTLNRYAKPVTMDDIIALDEDDSIAICTRYLLEEFDLFTDKRVTKSKNKAIPDNDKNSITSIITLYQCNRELLKAFRAKRKRENPNSKRDKKSLEAYLKFRPVEIEIELYQKFCLKYWKIFCEENNAIRTFDNSSIIDPARPFRNRETGGNLLFRPVGLLPYVQATMEIYKRSNSDFKVIHERLDNINYEMNSVPWKNILWNPIEKTMIMGSSGIVKLLLLYIYNKNIIRPSELTSLKEKYAAKLGLEIDQVSNALIEINRL